MTLRASDAIGRGIARLRLRDEGLDLIQKEIDMWRVTLEAERLILAAGKSQIFIQGRTEDRRMNRFGKRRGFPFFEDALMAAFAFIRAGEDFVQRRGLRFGLLRFGPLRDPARHN